MFRYTLMNDYMFKAYFSTEWRLKAFLKLLGIDLGDEKLLYVNTEEKNGIEAKGVRYDVRINCGYANVDLEAQNKASGIEAHRRREIHYLSQLHSSAYKDGSRYNEGFRSYVIFVNDFAIDDEAITVLKMSNLTTHAVYDDISIIDISLPNKDKCDNLELREFLDALKRREHKEYDTTLAKDAINMINYMNDDDSALARAQNAERTTILMNTIKDEAMKLGTTQGLELGIQEERKRNVVAFYNMGINEKDIAKAMGISIEEVLEYIKK